MTILLKQSTASQEIPLGFFVDSTDGDTEETALSIANTDIRLWKQGATAMANKNSGGATHMSNGLYYCVLDATDTDTLGALVVFVHVAGALPVRVECRVLAANVYDSLVAGTDNLQVDTVQVTGTSQTARDLGANIDAAVSTRASQTSVDTVDDFLDTEIAAIKTKTDQLTFTSANKVDATLQAAGDFAQGAADKVWSTAARTLTSFSGVQIKKNTALANFMFFMKQEADHVTPATSLSVTAERSIDGGLFATCANAVTEVGDGWYVIDLAAADLNGDVIALKFTAAGADQRNLTIVTQA